MKRIDAYWYSQNPVAWLLLPITAVYCFLVFTRRFFYYTGIFKKYKLPVPVIVIGNISVGGTGKTPLLIALCELLKQQGHRPGIVSRGYGGEFVGEHFVTKHDVASYIGDEPYLISQRTKCPLAVGRNRVSAAKLLLANSDCSIILSDDGLQHYRLERDIEIAIVDISRQFGNGFCLPSGPLREPVSRLKNVDIVVDHCSENLAGREDSFLLCFADVINIKTEKTQNIEYFKDRPVHAVAGIGHPSRFFNQLKKNHIAVIEHAYPDHYKFKNSDLEFVDGYNVLMTEKDAVKCQSFSNDNLWYVSVNAKLSEHLHQHFLSEVHTVRKGLFHE